MNSNDTCFHAFKRIMDIQGTDPMSEAGMIQWSWFHAGWCAARDVFLQPPYQTHSSRPLDCTAISDDSEKGKIDHA
jgi:hypothetical protein